LAAFLLALLKAFLATQPIAQISGMVRPLKRDTAIAAITSSISDPSPAPAASVRIAFEQAGSGSSWSSSIASAPCRGGAVGGKPSGAGSIHTTCQWRISRTWRSCCCSNRAVSAYSRSRKPESTAIWASRIRVGSSG
jgi:hypothetical protein